MVIFLSILETEVERREFLELYNLYLNSMILVAKKFFGSDRSSAEDAVQNAWIKVVENFSKILTIPCHKRGAYLVAIVKNEAISIMRKQKNHLPLDEAIVGEAVSIESDHQSVLEIIQNMPPIYRAILELRFIEERSTREIAKQLQLLESTVDTRIHRGRLLLIEKLEKEGYKI